MVEFKAICMANFLRSRNLPDGPCHLLEMAVLHSRIANKSST